MAAVVPTVIGTPVPSCGANEQAIATMCEFLGALFEEQDLILFRPVEVWTEDGRKKSRVDYRATSYHRLSHLGLRPTLTRLLERSATERLNLFFGVCPRHGSGGQFDLAGQIRVVRSLWTDIDAVTVGDVAGRLT